MIGKLMLIYRTMNNFGVRELADEIGVSAATISRVERGFMPDGHTMVKLIAWLFRDTSPTEKDAG